MRISDWSSDVCSSDLVGETGQIGEAVGTFGSRWSGAGHDRSALLGPAACRRCPRYVPQLPPGFNALRLCPSVLFSALLEVDPLVDRPPEQMAAQAIEPEPGGAHAPPIPSAAHARPAVATPRAHGAPEANRSPTFHTQN